MTPFSLLFHLTIICAARKPRTPVPGLPTARLCGSDAACCVCSSEGASDKKWISAVNIICQSIRLGRVDRRFRPPEEKLLFNVDYRLSGRIPTRQQILPGRGTYWLCTTCYHSLYHELSRLRTSRSAAGNGRGAYSRAASSASARVETRTSSMPRCGRAGPFGLGAAEGWAACSWRVSPS